MRCSPVSALLATAFASLGTAWAQDARPVAFTNATLWTMEGAAIQNGTLVIRDGRIQALGADVAPPAGAQIIDCKGGAILPGLVSAHSRAGLEAREEPRQQPQGGGRRRGGQQGDFNPGPRGGGAQNQAATKVVERVYARQRVFGELLRAGVTTLALTPNGGAFPGLGAILRPDGKTLEQLTTDDDAFVFVGMARDSQVKKLLKDNFEKARKIVEERKKPKEPPAAPPAEKPAEAPKATEPAKTEPPKGNEPPKPEPKPEPTPKPEDKKEGQPAAPAQAPTQKPPEQPKDPNLEVLADLLEGKRRAIVQIDSAADLLHWFHATGDSLEFPRAIAVSSHQPQGGTFDTVIDQCKKLKAPMLLPAELTTLPRSRFLVNPAVALHTAGIEIGFLVGENPGSVRQLFFRLMELVRNGLPAEIALKGVTAVPAKILGVDDHVGSLKVGKKANLLVLSGDPLDPVSELRSVWLEGRQVQKNNP